MEQTSDSSNRIVEHRVAMDGYGFGRLLSVSYYDPHGVKEFDCGSNFFDLLVTSAGILYVNPALYPQCDGDCQRQSCCAHFVEICMLPMFHVGPCDCCAKRVTGLFVNPEGIDLSFAMDVSLWSKKRKM